MTARSYPLFMTGQQIYPLYSDIIAPIYDLFHKRCVTIVTIDYSL